METTHKYDIFEGCLRTCVKSKVLSLKSKVSFFDLELKTNDSRLIVILYMTQN